jgi:hypothetical protein
MKWVAIAGTWRKTTPQIEEAVRTTVRDSMAREETE